MAQRWETVYFRAWGESAYVYMTSKNPGDPRKVGWQHRIPPKLGWLQEPLELTAFWKDPAVRGCGRHPDWLAQRQGCEPPVGGEQKAQPKTKQGSVFPAPQRALQKENMQGAPDGCLALGVSSAAWGSSKPLLPCSLSLALHAVISFLTCLDSGVGKFVLPSRSAE